MKNFGGLKIIMIATLALVIIAGTGAAVSLSNSGGGTWKYQREISIKENSGTALTDYQVLIELKGVDFPVEAKSDGADVRFTDSSGNELNYWIESWDYAGKSAKVWVKMSNMPASSTTTIRIYYGNPSASSASNGDKTFAFFDDFSGPNIDSANWDIANGDWVQFNGYVSGSGRGALKSKLFNPVGMIAEFKLQHVDGCRGGGGSYEDSNNWFFVHYRYLNHILLTAWDISPGKEKFVDYPENSVDSNWHTLILTFLSKTQTKIIFDNRDFGVYVNDYFDNSNGNFAFIVGRLVEGQDNWPNQVCELGGIGKYNFDQLKIRKFASSEPTITFAPPKSSSLSITKSASPYSLRQFQESTIKVLIENSGTSEVKAIEIMDSIHPSFDLTGGDFPNPKKFDSIRAGESRELQYTIKSKESGAFTLDPATVTYADSEGNIQEVKSEAVSIKVIPSSDGGSSGSNTGQNSKSASVSLHGEKTDVVRGEDILLRLSAVNLITKPKMHVQVIIIPPSGMSVTSSEFSKSAAGQFTANYQLEPGDGKDIEVRIRSNQVGDFNVNGRIIYYFGDDKDKAEDQTLNLPIKVRKEVASVPAQNPTEDPAQKATPGFEMIIGISGLFLLAIILKGKR